MLLETISKHGYTQIHRQICCEYRYLLTDQLPSITYEATITGELARSCRPVGTPTALPCLRDKAYIYLLRIHTREQTNKQARKGVKKASKCTACAWAGEWGQGMIVNGSER